MESPSQPKAASEQVAQATNGTPGLDLSPPKSAPAAAAVRLDSISSVKPLPASANEYDRFKWHFAKADYYLTRMVVELLPLAAKLGALGEGDDAEVDPATIDAVAEDYNFYLDALEGATLALARAEQQDLDAKSKAGMIPPRPIVPDFDAAFLALSNFTLRPFDMVIPPNRLASIRLTAASNPSMKHKGQA